MHKHKMLALGLMTPMLAFAEAPAGGEDEILEQIIVTAQKRASALQDVPFSVAAATETQIRNSGAANVVDLARNFAGLAIADLGPGQSQVAIRGISAGQVVRDQPGVKESVGIYLDESPISRHHPALHPAQLPGETDGRPGPHDQRGVLSGPFGPSRSRAGGHSQKRRQWSL